MQHLRLKGPYSCVSCEATAHPDEEVLSSFCDSQGGASSWGVAAAGAETSRTRGSSCGNREQESVKKLWPDFIELIHGYGCHSCAKTNFFFCHLGILCAHVCVDTGVPWFCAVLHPPPPAPPWHTHTGPCRGLCIIFLSPVRFYESPSLSEAIWGSISCVLDSMMSTLLIWTYLVLIKS